MSHVQNKMIQATVIAFLYLMSHFGGALAEESKLEPKSLFTIESEADLSRLKLRESSVSLAESNGQKAVKIEFKVSEKYPDVHFPPQTGSWDLSAFRGIRAEVTNSGQGSVKLAIRVDNPGKPDEKKWINGSVQIESGDTKMIEVLFEGGKKKGKKTAQYELDLTTVSAIHLFVNQPGEPVTILVKNLQAF